MKTTWKPHEEHGDLSTAERKELPDSVYAFPDKRKEPLTDASHVRTALARFDQVQDVTDAERDLAFANIRAAANHYGVDIAENDWRQLGKRPHTDNPAR
ncbi:hypothetical protein HC031_01090 [Planosporangium thailandense]|uniref:Uncharacterized protein n=1 Tax=Planosporangium thailandense TaxID=765197 RepID=A0ABX0XR69_9ACTN|nr:DUF6582 domain-containing protein [Planosporangium thailandense]NJC68321.1 hypothetical protein [Planosporangium thailandense]